MKINDLIKIIVVYIIFSFHGLTGSGNGYLEIEFWDVGQGDAIYISTPNGKKILIDGGDNFEVDYKVSKLMPFYSCYLDLVILTHPHYDHLYGLNRIMRRCKIGAVMFNDVDYPSRDFELFKEMSKKFNIKNVYAGDSFTIDKVEFKVLWPSKDFLNRKITDINDVSIIILLDYGDFEVLLTGDATDKVLGKIDLDSVKSLIDGEFDVLKVPHHGSKYSLEKRFYADLKPKKCIISVGAINKFGHPSPDAIKYFEETGCEIFRTDEMGDIKMKVF